MRRSGTGVIGKGTETRMLVDECGFRLFAAAEASSRAMLYYMHPVCKGQTTAEEAIVDKDCKLMFCGLMGRFPAVSLRRGRFVASAQTRADDWTRQAFSPSSEMSEECWFIRGRMSQLELRLSTKTCCLQSSKYGRGLTNYITALHKLRQGITKTH
jgi:hypothetical protein